MYHPITIPAESKMLLNIVKLKEGITVEDIELLLGEMCNIVKNKYGGDNGGFIAGQVFKSAGFISKEGSFASDKKDEENIAIVTYWRSFEQHEKSHADHAFSEKFNQLAEYCAETYEIGYDLLWQGEPDNSTT